MTKVKCLKTSGTAGSKKSRTNDLCSGSSNTTRKPATRFSSTRSYRMLSSLFPFRIRRPSGLPKQHKHGRHSSWSKLTRRARYHLSLICSKTSISSWRTVTSSTAPWQREPFCPPSGAWCGSTANNRPSLVASQINGTAAHFSSRHA